MKLSSLFAAVAAALIVSAPSLRSEPVIPAEYPLKTCPVSKEELGSGGMVAYKVNHEGTDVWLCCKACLKKFNKEAPKYTQAVKDAAAKK